MNNKTLISFVSRTTISVIVIGSLLLYQALVAQDDKQDTSNQTSEQKQIQRLEKRVKDLEEQLLKNQESLDQNKLNVNQPLKTTVLQHPIDVAFLNYKDRKRILITGGAGFVGSHLTDKLMLAGHEVIVADNMFTGKKTLKYPTPSVSTPVHY